MRIMHILWQRLVDERQQTCPRCAATEAAVEEAARRLERALKELDIQVVLDKKRLEPAAFLKAPLESNRIWIAGEPLEKWLVASTGQSRCCSACGDSHCRTLMVEGATYEAIPAALIVRAGLLAAAWLLQSESCAPSPSAGSV